MPEKVKLDELHAEAMANWEHVTEVDKEQRRLANEEALFLAAEDGQWSEDAKDKRRNRPMFTVDRISPAIDKIVGNQLQTRTGIKVYPKKDATKETADVLTGLIRSIEQESGANEAYDNAFGEGLEGGYGGWRILYDWVEGSFEREIQIAPLYSAATSSYPDPSCQRYDKKNAKWWFIISYLSPAQYKKEYPGYSVTDFPRETYKQDWFSTERIRIAEYWYKEKYKRRLGIMSDGRVLDLDEEKDVVDDLAADGVTLERERIEDAHKVYMTIMNGIQVLQDPELWAGKYIPIVPYWGKRRIIDGNTYTWGKIRKAKDAQRISNYTISANIETVALAPKDPILYTPENIKNHKTEWKYFNTKNTPFLGYTPDPQAAGSGGAPFRLGAPTVQTALVQQTQQAIDDVRTAVGADAALGQMGADPRSGEAFLRQDQSSDLGSYSYHDNLEKSKKYTGEQLIDLISKVMDTEEQIQIVGPNDKMEEVAINQTVYDEETSKDVIVNDLSIGKYGVLTKTGPTAATKRQETVQQLSEFTANDPEMRLLAGDILISNMDMNEGEELTKRFRKRQIDQGIVEPTKDEIKEYGLDQQQSDPMQDELVKNLQAQTEETYIDTEKKINEAELKEAERQKKIMETSQVAVEAYYKMIDAITKKRDAGGNITEEEWEMVTGQVALIQQAQEEVIMNEEIAGSVPAGPPPPVGIQSGEQELYENRETPINIGPPSPQQFSQG